MENCSVKRMDEEDSNSFHSTPPLHSSWTPIPPEERCNYPSPGWVVNTLQDICKKAASDRSISTAAIIPSVPTASLPTSTATLPPPLKTPYHPHLTTTPVQLKVPSFRWQCSNNIVIEAAAESVFSSLEGRSFEEWTLVSTIPVALLPTLFNVIPWLRVHWIQVDYSVSECLEETLDAPLRGRSPRISGNFFYSEKEHFITQNSKPVLTEHVRCAGTVHCNPSLVENFTKGTKRRCNSMRRKYRCSAEVKVKVFLPRTGQLCQVFIRGNHRDSNFTELINKNPDSRISISWELKQLAISGRLTGKTPKAIGNEISILATTASIPSTDIANNPPPEKVLQLVKNLTRQQHPSDVSKYSMLVEKAAEKGYILYNRISPVEDERQYKDDENKYDEEDISSSNNNNQSLYKVFTVIASHLQLKALIRFGKEIVGLDSVYKWTKYRICIWALVVSDDNGHGLVTAWCISTTSDGHHVHKFIQIVKSAIKKFVKCADSTFDVHSWNPIFSIDKDEAEANGITLAGHRFVLCEFHVAKTLNRRFSMLPQVEVRKRAYTLFKNCQRSTTIEQLHNNIRNFTAFLGIHNERLLNYFEKEWFNEKWLKSLTDVDRPFRYGLWNTTSIVESQFRSTLQVHFNQKGGYSLHEVIRRLTDNIMMEVNSKIQRIEMNLKQPSRKGHSEMAHDRIIARAQDYLQSGKIEFQEYMNPPR